jgi:hypothetical protein
MTMAEQYVQHPSHHFIHRLFFSPLSLSEDSQQEKLQETEILKRSESYRD